MRADVFYWKLNTRRESVGEVLVEVPPGTDLVEIIRKAGEVERKKLTERTTSTGVFEVQTDDGVWSATDGGALVNFNTKRGCRLRPQAVFKTWAELEQEEKMGTELRVPAIEIRQGEKRIYTMGLDGKLVQRFATISRLKRTAGALAGYQRPEALAHVRAIREYMETASAMVPNAVVLSFNKTVRFELTVAPEILGSTHTRVGQLVIPLPADGTPPEDFPGFVVDGQQRLAAVREAAVEAFPLAVCAFITEDLGEQTEQFVLVNSVKPLPRSLIHELLPVTHAQLPEHLQKRRLPAMLLARLNLEEGSPLKGLIITQTNPRQRGKGTARTFSGIIQDTALLKSLEASLSDGALYNFCSKEGEPDIKGMLELLTTFWSAVAEVFPKAWGKVPAESRLTHGAGVAAMGFLLDEIYQRLHREHDVEQPSVIAFVKELRYVAEDCRWLTGSWDFPREKRAWNAIQNTSQDIRLLADYLAMLYRERSKGKAPHKARKK